MGGSGFTVLDAKIEIEWALPPASRLRQRDAAAWYRIRRMGNRQHAPRLEYSMIEQTLAEKLSVASR